MRGMPPPPLASLNYPMIWRSKRPGRTPVRRRSPCRCGPAGPQRRCLLTLVSYYLPRVQGLPRCPRWDASATVLRRRRQAPASSTSRPAPDRSVQEDGDGRPSHNHPKRSLRGATVFAAAVGAEVSSARPPTSPGCAGVPFRKRALWLQCAVGTKCFKPAVEC